MLFTRREAAKFRGVTREAIHYAIKRGNIKETADGLIDTHDPHNKAFFSNEAVRRSTRHSKMTKQGLSASTINPNPQTPDETPTYEEYENQLDQKSQAEVKWKRIQTRLKTLEYAKKVGAVVDRETVEHLFGNFNNVIRNSLATLPKTIAPILWSIATSHDEPVVAIEEELERQLAFVISEAKDVATRDMPPRGGARYVFLEIDEVSDDE